MSSILDRVHDRCIDLSKIFYNENSNELILPISVESIEPKCFFRKMYIFKYGIFAELEAQLVFKNVKSWNFTDPDGIGASMVNNIKISKNKFEIICSTPGNILGEGLDIELELIISKLEVGEKRAFVGFF